MNRRLLPVLSLVLFAASLHADVRIVSISPSSAPLIGGTPIVITLSERPAAACPVLTPPPAVVFDATYVEARFLDDVTLRAIAPPHPPGTVDIGVVICGIPEIVARKSFHYFEPAPPDPAAFERVLLPVFFFGAGAHGSEWTTTALAFNDGPGPIELANPVFEGNSMCPAVCGCSARKDVRPRETSAVCQGFASTTGLLIYPPRNGSDLLRYLLRIRDLSREADSAGTDVPVVRESDLRPGRVVLLDVPGDAKFRTALRVYDVMARDGVEVRMQIYRAGSPEGALVDRVVTLSQPIRTIIYDPFPAFPAYAYVSDPVLEVPVMSPRAESFRIELTALPPLERFWAFVSITNNDTQQVTLVTPQ